MDDDELNDVQGDVSDQNETPGQNPAWNDVLNALPAEFHNIVTPHFQKWDQAANSRIESLNAELKGFEDYKPFAEHGITQAELEQGLRLMYEINNNPQGVYEALASAYKYGQTPGNNAVEEDEEEASPLTNDPRFDQLQQGLELVSKIVLNDAQAKQQASADQALEKELADVKAEFGDNIDEDYLLTKMLAGHSAKDAAKSYQALIQRVTPQPFAPNVLGNSNGGAGVPSNAIDPRKLSGSDTRNLVVEMLKRANEQG